MGLVDIPTEEQERRSCEMWERIRQGQRIQAVLSDVAEERRAQDAKWGEQNHPDGTSSEYVDAANHQRDLTNQRAKDSTLTWLDILFEEVFETAAEEDPAKLRAELVQVAAVAAAWIEAIDRRE